MWIWIILIIILGAGLISALKGREKCSINEAFCYYADFLYDRWCRIWPDWYKVDDYFWNSRVADNLQLIHPTKKRQELFEKHRRKKLSNVLMIVSACAFLGLVVCISDLLGGVLEDGRIKRGSYGEGEKNVSLVAEYGEKREGLNVVIREKEYTASEMDEIMEEEFISLKEIFAGGDTSEISSDVKMPGSAYDGIIDVSWRFSDYDVIDGEGHYHDEVLREKLSLSGEDEYPFTATAILRYRDMKKEQDWDFNIVLPEYSPEEKMYADIADALSKSEEDSLYEDFFYLPENVSGVDITWKEKDKGAHMGLLLLGLLAGVAVYISMDKEVDSSVEQRNKEMTLDYPEFISKLTLMISAGISFVNAWSRITEGYEHSLSCGGRKRYVYEEMRLTLRELQSGKSEREAVAAFGERCRIPCYKRFSTIVTQSLKKGLSGLSESLNFEARQSFEIRKSNAKILGEQASSKLLLPMGIMLTIVLVIVMAPAFLSMSL